MNLPQELNLQGSDIAQRQTLYLIFDPPPPPLRYHPLLKPLPLQSAVDDVNYDTDHLRQEDIPTLRLYFYLNPPKGSRKGISHLHFHQCILNARCDVGAGMLVAPVVHC